MHTGRVDGEPEVDASVPHRRTRMQGGYGADAVDAVLYYNFAVLLEDIGRIADAMRLYESALRLDPELADAHYNLALLYEARGRRTDAIRHMARYRKLVRS